MTEVPYNGGIPTVAPDARPPDAYQRINIDPNAFGAATAKGLEQFGAGLQKTSDNLFDINTHWSKIQTDEELNNAQRDVHNTLEGFKKLHGADALSQQEDFNKQIDESIKQRRANLKSDTQRVQFDNTMRPFRERYVAGQMTSHAVSQGYSYALKVNQDTFNDSLSMIPSAADDPAAVEGFIGDAANAKIKQVEVQYGSSADPKVKLAAIREAKQAGYKTWIETVATTNPVKAQEMAETYKKDLGPEYIAISNHLRARTDQIEGRQGADQEMGRAPETTQRSQTIIQKFEAAGYSHEQAAAVAGHFYHESGNNPNAVHDGGIGLGIAGWNGDRLTALKKFAADRGKSPNDFDTQVDFAIKELDTTEGKAGTALRGAKSLDDATTAFMHYERPRGYTPDNPKGGDSYGARLSNAAKFAGGNFAALPDKATTFERIVDRYRDDPGKQNAALAWANHVYTIYNTERTQQQAAFKASVQDDQAQAARTGAVAQPKTELDFLTNYGAENGPKAYSEYQQQLQLGADAASVATMNPQEKFDLLKRYEPQPGDGYASQWSRQESLRKAIDATNKEALSDPGQFALQRLPAVAAAHKAMTDAIGNQQLDEAGKQSATRNFVNVTLAEQERIGIPPVNRNVLPNDIAQKINLELMKPGGKDGQGSADVAANIEAQAKLWGENWPLVYKQISKDSMPIVRVVGSGVTPQAARILTELAPLKLPDILKDENAEKASTIKKDVLDAFKPFAASLAGSEDRLPIFNDFRGQAEKLAAYYVVNGKTSSEAAEQSFKDLLGHKYTFTSTYRIPKAEPYKQADIENGAALIKGQLGADDFAPPRDTIGGLSPEYLAGVKPKAFARDSVWVTAPGDAGLMLVYNDEAVRGKDGQPFIRTWKQISTAATDARADLTRGLREAGSFIQ